ncbi:WD40-repeat-containing domain protein [Phycomyces nitens]|nr:WD40-repeat-containing domain protein [Phycomyces nitens]
MQITKPTASNSQSQSDSRLGNVNKDELVRLLLQTLQDLDYHGPAMMLEKESGVTLESDNVTSFRQAILTGDWPTAEALLPTMALSKTEDLSQAIFLIRQQRFLELLEDRKTLKALYSLRTELTPLGLNVDRIHELSSLILCSTVEDVKAQARWDGAAGKSRELLLVELQRYILPSSMIPKERMLTLINQAFKWQRRGCLYHVSESDHSLFEDHVCDKSRFPKDTIRVLEGHADQVWYIAFSHNGKYLASVSKDKTCTIWDVNTFEVIQVLSGQPESSSYCEWSPDDKKLLICGCDHAMRLWDPMTGSLLHSFHEHKEQVTSCAWLPDGKHVISGGCDEKICLWTLDGGLVNSWESERVLDMKLSLDGRRLVTVSYEMNITVYDFEFPSISQTSKMREVGAITSLSLTKDGRYALVNINIKESQEIHLWDLEDQSLVRKYTGHKQGEYIIRSTFGGLDESFILSGSEDNCVYVWSREHQDLLEVLHGHTDTVNCVSWYPTSHTMFGSGSDDGTIRIWGLKSQSPLCPDDKGKFRA